MDPSKPSAATTRNSRSAVTRSLVHLVAERHHHKVHAASRHHAGFLGELQRVDQSTELPWPSLRLHLPTKSATAEVIPTFFAYSASGSVSVETVYANYGREKDFAYLVSAGIDVAGKVALARYGRIHCEDIVHNARAAGTAASVVYTDLLEYGGPPGEGSFPNTRWPPPTGVQVGTLFRGVGDPTTPMWASSEGCGRVSVEDAMATDDMTSIPALPRGPASSPASATREEDEAGDRGDDAGREHAHGG